MSRQYTDAEKLAYYKRRAAGIKGQPKYRAPAMSRAVRPATVGGYGKYKAKRTTRTTTKKSSSLIPKAPDSVGSQIGAWLGHGAQKVLQAITGFGDYSIAKNSLMEGGMSPPQIVNASQSGGVILRHREYIKDVVASETFDITTLDLNPGISSTFPWLSQIAQAFELYRMRGLVFEFKSMSSDAVLSSGSNSALGTVAMATQYNSLNPSFTNLLSLENHEFANASKPSCDFYHPVECKRSLIPNAELYVRTGDVPEGGDKRLYDLGQFNLAVSGNQAAGGVLGQLWCTYEIELYQHQYVRPSSVLSAHIQSTGCASANPFGTAFSFDPHNSIAISLNNVELSMPSNIVDGRYMIVIRWLSGSGAQAFAQPVPTFTNATAVSMWQGGSTIGGSVNATQVTSYVIFVFDVTAGGAALTLGTGGTLTTSTSDIWITQVDADLSGI